MAPSMLMSMPLEAAETGLEKKREERRKSIVVDIAVEREEELVLGVRESKIGNSSHGLLIQYNTIVT